MAQTKINKRATKFFAGIHRSLYKLTGGRGMGASKSIVILGTTGRKSGERREQPLIAGEHPDGWVVVASFSGHDAHPAWYLNLMADPTATLQVGADQFDVQARETSGDERSTLWDEMVEQYGDYAEYQKVTDREIPVLVLERSDSA